MKSSNSKPSIEKKEEKDKRTISKKTTLVDISEYPESESEKSSISEPTMSASLSSTVPEIMETNKIVSLTKDEDFVKAGKQSWSELMEDEDKNQVCVDSNLTIESR